MSLWSRALLAVSGLMGAAGIALAAAGAHMGGENLTSAATFLLIHAAAVAGLSASGSALRGPGISACLLALGAILFSGDLAARVFLGGKLFPMAAPAGGIIMIAGWLSLTVFALAARRKAPPSQM
jgi:uncharacterized membrane protein YgdD (TMEM256/DUF423 family)